MLQIRAKDVENVSTKMVDSFAGIINASITSIIGKILKQITNRCHAWWEGQRCDKRMARIPYKPLSDRMLQEPFWLGLITVFVVLAFIGLVWCAKRHFPEKIEKLLAEEAERNRRMSLIHIYILNLNDCNDLVLNSSGTATRTSSPPSVAA